MPQTWIFKDFLQGSYDMHILQVYIFLQEPSDMDLWRKFFARTLSPSDVEMKTSIFNFKILDFCRIIFRSLIGVIIVDFYEKFWRPKFWIFKNILSSQKSTFLMNKGLPVTQSCFLRIFSQNFQVPILNFKENFSSDTKS